MLAALLLTTLVLLQTTPGEAAQAPASSTPEAEADEAGDLETPLQDHEVARIDGVSVSVNTFYHYLSLVFARMPEGNQALEQLLLEEILQQRAATAQLEVSEEEVDAVFAELESRARQATGGEQGLLDSLGGPDKAEALRHSVSLATLHRKLVAHELQLPSGEDVNDAMLQTWLDGIFESAGVEEAPLDDDVAVRWTGGSLSRPSVGARIAQILSPAERKGLLTELLGIHAIRQRATVMGIELTPEEAAVELQERELQVASNLASEGIGYEDVVSQVNHRSIPELVASPKFGAEVLLRIMVDLAWDEASLRSLFEAERALFEEQLGGPADFAQARFAVIKEVRQRSYQQLLASVTIIRRF